MGRLTTIDDMEKKAAAGQEDAENERASQVEAAAVEHGFAAEHQRPVDQQNPASQQRPASSHAQALPQAAQRAEQPAKKTGAQQEADFHGLDSLEKHSSGHIVLIVVAVVIVVAAALKIANII